MGNINDTIASLTGITNEKVKNADNIIQVGNDFINFLHDQLDFKSAYDVYNSDDEDNNDFVNGKIIILVAHNGNRFDIPFLLSKLSSDVVRITRFASSTCIKNSFFSHSFFSLHRIKTYSNIKLILLN